MNKIGIDGYRLEKVEKEIIRLKLNLIDKYFTFNKENYDLEYLQLLHNFLFSDFYDGDDLGTRELDEYENNIIELYLKKICYLSINYPNKKEKILELIREIWDLQPFYIGNTRTLIAFLKVINCAFLLDLEIDANMEINNKSKVFCIENFVNQKRLTRNK